MNPIIAVLCTAAICCELEQKSHWTGTFLIIAMALAGWQNYRQTKMVEKILGKKR